MEKVQNHEKVRRLSECIPNGLSDQCGHCCDEGEETGHVILASNFASSLSPDTQIKLDSLFLFNSHYKVSAMDPQC